MSTLEDESGLFEARRVALEALQSNEAQQQKLRQFIARLKAGIDDNEVEQYSSKERDVVEMDETQQPKCIQVKDSIKVRILTELSNPDSPFYEDAMKRERYLEKIKPRPWTTADRQILKGVVISEQKRRYALGLKESGQVDVLDAVQAHPDSFYESMDAVDLDWDKVANKVALLLPSSTSSRSATDCKVQWLGSDHPKIKKGPWTAEELSDLRAAVHESIIPTEEQEDEGEIEETTSELAVDWIQVSEKLGGTRVAAECLRQWLKLGARQRFPAEEHSLTLPERSVEPTPGVSAAVSELGDGSAAGVGSSTEEKIKQKQKEGNPGQAWTEEEDQALLDLVSSHGKNNWSFVASMLPYVRSARQCSDRYRNSLDPSIRRAKWTKEEDDNLAKAVAELGPKWSKVKQFVPGRTGAQCRERWVNQVDPSVKRTDFTEEEDARIIELKAKGLDWPAIAAEIGGRTDNQCWRRWKILQKGKTGRSNAKSKGKNTQTQIPVEPEAEFENANNESLNPSDLPGDKPKARPRPRTKSKARQTGDSKPSGSRASAAKTSKRKRQTDADDRSVDGDTSATPAATEPARGYSLRKKARVDYHADDQSRSDEDMAPKTRQKDRKGKGKATIDDDLPEGRSQVSSVLEDDQSSSLSPAPFPS
ncbi:hypothetical protein M407DRAFT_20842 [Tulasnella calospora MUT 4182]|uniref:Uncharacterized protein n=1 Tax=Tulasnella calospora MUT 4182 TaxID=1051891 RepID=A0A0C3QF67_9AGAM|nr:hypothetical protein M407DRAFT_20842 [Tulasnella calospora MUT 4182]